MRALVVWCVVIAILGGVPLASAQSTPDDDQRTTALIVDVEADGDARWTVETYLPLSGPNETQGFRELGGRYVEEETQAGQTPETFRRIATQVSDETGRAMRIQNASRSWRIENRTPTTATPPATDGAAEAGESVNKTGVLTYSFTWTNFARTEDDQVVVGDAFDTSDRWLPGLREEQSLIIRAPDNYSITRASVGHTRKTVRWEGPTTFQRDDLKATFTSTNDTRTSPTRPEGPTIPISMEGLLAILAAILLAGVAYGVARRSSPADDAVDDDTIASATTQPSSAGGGSAVGGGGVDAGVESDDPFAGVDEDLLSDEERIERHLEAAGGRMKQAEIVDRTGWSNAKVSQVLSQMDEEGRVDKLRIGRENLISLPEEEE